VLVSVVFVVAAVVVVVAGPVLVAAGSLGPLELLLDVPGVPAVEVAEPLNAGVDQVCQAL